MSVLKSINPATEKILLEYKEIDISTAKKIISSSSIAQLNWSRLDIARRSEIVSDIGELITTDKQSYAEIITSEMGKPISESIAEVEKCVWLCEYYAENAHIFLADQYIDTDAKKSFITFEPLGVIFGVMPWNFPFWQVFRFVIPTIIAGNTVIVKHASNVTGCLLAIDKIFKESGFDWREPGCSMCLAMNADKLNPKERCASTSNRNFEGRQGRGGRTHLVSPAMAAAAAIDGHLTDVRKFQN